MKVASLQPLQPLPPPSPSPAAPSASPAPAAPRREPHGHDEARRDIWCKFVEIFIHFSIGTLCKGIASAAKATGLTEVGIVFSAVR